MRVPVRGPRLEALDGRERDAGEERVVHVREPARVAALDRGHLERHLRPALEHRDAGALRDVEGLHVPLAGEEPLDRAAGDRHAREMAVAAVFEQEEDRSAVRREARRRDVAIERRRERADGAARGRNHRHVVRSVPQVLRIAALQEGDEGAVGAPHRRAVLARRVDEPAERPARGGHHEDVGVLVGVRVGRAVAHERDVLPVRRPGGRAVVVGTGRQLHARPARDVEGVHVAPHVPQVALAVALELAARDHDRPRPLLVRRVRVVRGLVGIGVRHDQRETRPVGRPLEVGDAARVVRELRGLAAAPVEQVHLRALAVALREEREVAPVRAEPGVRLGLVARGHPERVAARERDQVDVRVRVVLLRAQRAHRERDPLPVGRELGVAHVLQGQHVGGTEVPPLRTRGRCERRADREEGGSRERAHGAYLKARPARGGGAILRAHEHAR